MMNSEEKPILSENSDDDDLPELGGSNVNIDKKFEVAQNDIVWAEFRKQYWPALVRCVKKKERKVSIWYLDSPKKCFKVPFSKIKSFSDPKMTELVKIDLENSPVKAKHKRVWLNAMTYIRRRTQGYEDDPASYFDLNKHYLAYKDKGFDDPCLGEVENVAKIEDVGTTLNTGGVDPTSSDDESLVSDDDDDNGIDKKLSLFANLSDAYEADGPEADNIVKCIAAGHVDKHLLQVKSKKIKSSYLDMYEDAMRTNKSKLMYITPGHVRSMEKLKEIAIYLMNFYEKVVEGGKCEMINYVMYVWMPEAINKAVELIEKGSLDLDQPISELRKRLFPTDELVNDQIYNPLTLLLEEDKNKGKKWGQSECGEKKQAKKIKVSNNDSENNLSIKSPIKMKISLNRKFPNKSISKPLKKSTSEKKSMEPCKEENNSLTKTCKGENKPPKKICKRQSKSPTKICKGENKSPTKSRGNKTTKLPTRTSPRKKV